MSNKPSAECHKNHSKSQSIENKQTKKMSFNFSLIDLFCYLNCEHYYKTL